MRRPFQCEPYGKRSTFTTVISGDIPAQFCVAGADFHIGTSVFLFTVYPRLAEPISGEELVLES